MSSVDQHRRHDEKRPLPASYVMLFELVGLIVAVLVFGPLISSARTIPAKANCDLGTAEWVPYVANHRHIYCGLETSAAQWTLCYYAVSLLIIVLSQFLYVRRRAWSDLANVPRKYIWAPVIFLISSCASWVFGLNGTKFDMDGLPAGSVIPFIVTLVVVALSHAWTMLTLYEL